jgi:hypothetical protein
LANDYFEVVDLNRSENDPVSRIPSVLILLLNFNSEQDTLACLRSLEKIEYPKFELLIVDNGSESHSVQAIREAYPRVPIVLNESNLGFVEGNNLGLHDALKRGDDYTLLLNNDTEVAPDFLTKLVEAAESDPLVVMLGPTIYYYDEPDRIWSAGGQIQWTLGKATMLGINEVDEGQYGSAWREVDFVTGCALLVRMSILESVGMLDPRFFLYYEEVEWCSRASRAGYKIMHVPQSKVWHKISPESRAASPLVHYYMTRNRLLFLHSAKLGIRAWAHTLLLDYARTILSWSLRPKWRSLRPMRYVMLRAILDYFSGRFGQMEEIHQRS